MNQEEMDQGARKVKLAADFGAANAAVLEEHAEDLKCPHGYRRAPVTSPGDAVLFDFRTKHRVLPNKSNQTRALLYWGFSRQWYKDHNCLEARAFTAAGGERLKMPRDAARGSAFDRQVRKTLLKQDQTATRYYLDANGCRLLDKNGNPLEGPYGDGPGVYEPAYQPWLYNRGYGRSPAISTLLHQ
eukprot:gene12018-33098_t